MASRDPRPFRASRALGLAVILSVVCAFPQAQSASKKPLGVDDYTKWRPVSGQEISADGRWVTYGYPNEGHGLRGMANRKDLTIRFFQFFDHYLKGEPAPKWLSEGVPLREAG